MIQCNICGGDVTELGELESTAPCFCCSKCNEKDTRIKELEQSIADGSDELMEYTTVNEKLKRRINELEEENSLLQNKKESKEEEDLQEFLERLRELKQMNKEVD